MRLKDSLYEVLLPQFVRPHGFAGRLAGWEMSLRPSNRKRNRWVVDLLEVQPGDHVLEVGFGPGLAIRELSRRATDGLVFGIDHSEVMVRQASARNRTAVNHGRVELHVASALALGRFRDLFDKVLAVNNFGMWPDPEVRLNELLGAIRPGGRLAIVSQPRCPGASAATSEQVGMKVAERLPEAGFINVRKETLNSKPPVVCVLAETPERQT